MSEYVPASKGRRIFTVPLYRHSEDWDGPEQFATATLITYCGRFFIVTAKHVFHGHSEHEIYTFCPGLWRIDLPFQACSPTPGHSWETDPYDFAAAELDPKRVDLFRTPVGFYEVDQKQIVQRKLKGVPCQAVGYVGEHNVGPGLPRNLKYLELRSCPQIVQLDKRLNATPEWFLSGRFDPRVRVKTPDERIVKLYKGMSGGAFMLGSPVWPNGVKYEDLGGILIECDVWKRRQANFVCVALPKVTELLHKYFGAPAPIIFKSS